MPSKKHKVLITNPMPREGHPDVVVKGIVAKGYIIVPIEAGLFEVYMGKQYLGEAETMAQVKKLITRDGADAPVLIQNPNGGYEMYSYKSPSSNPKKKAKKKATKRKPAKKKAAKKKATKRKPAKKKAAKKKTSARKKKRISSAKKKVKKATKKVKSAKKKVKSAKKKVKSAKKKVRKAKSGLSKAKRSKNPAVPNPKKRKKKAKKKVAPRAPLTISQIEAYVRQVTGKKF